MVQKTELMITSDGHKDVRSLRDNAGNAYTSIVVHRSFIPRLPRFPLLPEPRGTGAMGV